MWKFFYFESQSLSGSFLSCRIGFWIRNDFVHVKGRRKFLFFYFSRDQNIKTEFLSLSKKESFRPMWFCNLTSTFYTTFMVPRKYRTSPKVYMFVFSYELSIHFYQNSKTLIGRGLQWFQHFMCLYYLGS